jgi:hypothetical protein
MFSSETYNKDNVDNLLKLTPHQLKELIPWKEGGNKEGTKFIKDKDKEEECRKILAGLRRIKKSNYQQDIKYSPCGTNKDGRLYVRGGIKSLQNLMGCIRDYIKPEELIDYDIRSAHPHILAFIIETHYPDNIITNLKDYLINRELIHEKHNIDKLDVIKTINTDRPKLTNPWLKVLNKELYPVKKLIFQDTKYNYLHDKDKRKNPMSSLLNKLMCIEERRALEKVKEHFPYDVYMFDGFMSREKYDVEDLNNITKEWGMKWAIKPPKPLEYKEPEQAEMPDNLKSYDKVKEEFELTNFALRNPVVFVEQRPDGELIMRKIQDFRIIYTCLWFYQETFNPKTKEMEYKRTKFIPAWLEDEFKREYSKVDFIPPPKYCPEDVFNLFTGFAFERENWEEYYEPENFDIIINHVKKLVGPDCTEEGTEYFLNYLAHTLQYPGVKPRVSLVIQSEEGVGKNMFVDNFMRIICGTDYYLSSENSDDFIGQFVGRLEQTICGVWNETDANDTFRNMKAIKALITEDTQRINRKGIQPYFVNSYLRLIFFSNNDTPVKVKAGDRRFQVFTSSAPEPGDYYEKLYSAMTNKNVLYGFVKMLLERDVKNIDFRRTRIETDYYRVLKSGNNGLIDRFITRCFYNKTILVAEKDIHEIEINGEKPNVMSKSGFHGEYTKWCEANSVKPLGKIKFYYYFNKKYQECFKQKKIRGVEYYNFYPKKILDKLVNIREIDEQEVNELIIGVDEEVETKITPLDWMD